MLGKNSDTGGGTMSDVITIGIAGGTGSSKTTITRRILDEFGGDVSVLAPRQLL